MHGRGDRVVCMDCGHTGCRGEYHDRLDAANRPWLDDVRAALGGGEGSSRRHLRADGDAEIPSEAYRDVVVPPLTRAACFAPPLPEVREGARQARRGVLRRLRSGAEGT